jgi:hypothetical protein
MRRLVAAIMHRCGTLHKRGIFDKSPDRSASSTRHLVIEATYRL